MESTNEDEIDEIVIAQADDDDAWEEEIVVTPVSHPGDQQATPRDGG